VTTSVIDIHRDKQAFTNPPLSTIDRHSFITINGAKGCASLGRQWWHGEGMRRPKRAMVARRWDAPAYIGNGGAARGMRRPKGNGGAARGCAGEKMVMVAWRGDAPAKNVDGHGE
jgi:hypothetical protein